MKKILSGIVAIGSVSAFNHSTIGTPKDFFFYGMIEVFSVIIAFGVLFLLWLAYKHIRHYFSK